MALPKEPSERQEAILEFIWRYLQKHARPPAYREIKSGIGASSVSVVSHHVRQLETAGFLRRDEHVARGLSLTDNALAFLERFGQTVQEATDIVRVQITGDIRAGDPVDLGNDTFRTYDVDETIAVDAHLLPKRKTQLEALRVRGDSMIDALVQEGDIVIMQPATEVRDGDMVAAWLQLEQELTLKRFYLEGAQIRLQPANKALEPIYTPATNVEIQGKVVLVLRSAESKIV